MSLASLPENGTTVTVNSTISNSDQQLLFTDDITIGGGYVGCLDRLIVNLQQVALLNPTEDDDINTCGPRLPSQAPRAFESGSWLFGAGSYIQLSSQQLQLSEFEVQFDFRTLDASGILLYYPYVDKYLLVYIFEGRLAVDCSLSALDFIHLETESTFNSGWWHEVSLLMNGLNITVAINGSLTLFRSAPTIVNPVFTPSGVLFLGGISANYSLDADNLATSSSIAGCVRNLRFGGGPVVNLQNSTSRRVDFGGCPQEVQPGVRFMGTGRAEFLVTSQQFQNITFTFRTDQVVALLFNFGEFSISIFHTKLRLDICDGFVLVSDGMGLNDNTPHAGSVLISSSGNTSMCESSFLPPVFDYASLFL